MDTRIIRKLLEKNCIQVEAQEVMFNRLSRPFRNNIAETMSLKLGHEIAQRYATQVMVEEDARTMTRHHLLSLYVLTLADIHTVIEEVFRQNNMAWENGYEQGDKESTSKVKVKLTEAIEKLLL